MQELDGYTALMLAALNNNFQVFELLYEFEKEIKNKDGKTVKDLLEEEENADEDEDRSKMMHFIEQFGK